MIVPIANRANMLANILSNIVGSNIGQHVGTVCEGLKENIVFVKLFETSFGIDVLSLFTKVQRQRSYFWFYSSLNF